MQQATGMMATIGLRHVLEDGAAVLQGLGPVGSRREFVLSDLRKILERAATGAQAAETPRSLLQSSDPTAVNAYSLMYKYLSSDYREELTSKIISKCGTISRIASNEPTPAQEREAAHSFVKMLLSRLSADEAYSRQSEPEVFPFG